LNRVRLADNFRAQFSRVLSGFSYEELVHRLEIREERDGYQGGR